MKVFDTQGLLKQYSAVEFKMNAYAQAKLNFAGNQFTIKIQDYNFVVIPYQISMIKMIYLAILNHNEITFFQKFVNTLCTIIVPMKEPGKPQPTPVPIRAKITNINAIKGRDNLSLLQVGIPNCPENIVQAIGQYLDSLKELDKAYDEFKDQEIVISREINKKIGYNNISEFYFNKEKSSCRVTSIGMDKIKVNVPRNLELLKANKDQQIKLYFRRYRIETGVTFIEGQSLGPGLTQCTFQLQKSYPLLEILEEYFFEKRILEKKDKTDKKEE